MSRILIGIGAQKCATTWTYEVLRAHPDIRMSAVKELHYFSQHFDRGADWYARQFPGGAGELRGEVSTSYLYDPAVPERIGVTVDDPRLVLSVRNPVDRFVSHYKHLIRDGVLAAGIPILEAIDQVPALLSNGAFATHLKPFLAVFPRAAFLIISAERAESAPHQVVQMLYEHAGVRGIEIPQIALKRVSPGVLPRNQRLENSRRTLYRLLKRSPLAGLISVIRRSGLSDAYRTLNKSQDSAHAVLSLGDRQEVWARSRAQVDELEELLGQRFPEIRER